MAVTTEERFHIGKGMTKAWSAPATSRTTLALLADLDWPNARVADVGAGRGHFSQLLCDYLRGAHGLEPEGRVLACDLLPESFGCEEVECAPIGADGRLPYADDSLDAVVAIEVVEHVEDQFAFLRELARVAKPGAPVIVTTPNTLNMNSRLRTFTWGFPVLYDPLPLEGGDPRLLAGHIHPISPYYLAYDAARAGLTDLRLVSDRTKRSAGALALLFAPALLLGRFFALRRLRRKRPALLEQNRGLLDATSGWRLLTGRTAILSARKPRTSEAPDSSS